MIPRTSGFLLSTPSSSRTLLISAASMVPLPSSSKTSKVCLSYSQSWGSSLSFQLVGADLEVTLDEVVGLV